MQPTEKPSHIRQGFLGFEHALKKTAKSLRSLAILDIFDQLSRISIAVVAIMYVLDADDRRRDGIYKAWQVVNGAYTTKASAGRIEALEFLVKNNVSLGYINLEGVNLRGAKLNGVDFSHASLGEADLSNAQLRGANFLGADVRQTKFAGANLAEANLNVWGWLNNDLISADLTNASGFTQEMLDNSCVNEATKLSPGFKKPKPCNE